MIGDLIDKVIDYETGVMAADQIIGFFQELIDSDLAWSLQGSYGRCAQSLIDSGQCVQKSKEDKHGQQT